MVGFVVVFVGLFNCCVHWFDQLLRLLVCSIVACVGLFDCCVRWFALLLRAFVCVVVACLLVC